MRPLRLLTALSATALLAAASPPAAAQPRAAVRAAPAVSPRDVAGRIADGVQQAYFDPARASTIAQDLRARAAQGEFDRFTDPRDLAEALSGRLRPYDTHFSVTWSPEAGVGPAQAPARRQAPQPQGNQGFQEVALMPGGVGYIDLREFADLDPSGALSDPARRAADAAMTLIAPAAAVIIDLRENGGGSPAMVGYLVAHFVPEGADVYNVFKSRGPDGNERPPFPPPPGARRTDVPLYILISGRTASAAESFAYTLQAAGRATTVGEASAGGANPGGPLAVGGGFSVFVSRASPVNPITHANWEGTGVKPDVATPAAGALARAQGLALRRIAAQAGGGVAKTRAGWALEALEAAAPPAAPLSDYAGTYSGRSIGVEDGRLVYRYGRRPPRVLKPLSADLFYIEGLPLQRVRFDRDAARKVIAVDLLAPEGDDTRLLREARRS